MRHTDEEIASVCYEAVRKLSEITRQKPVMLLPWILLSEDRQQQFVEEVRQIRNGGVKDSTGYDRVRNNIIRSIVVELTF